MIEKTEYERDLVQIVPDHDANEAVITGLFPHWQKPDLRLSGITPPDLFMANWDVKNNAIKLGGIYRWLIDRCLDEVSVKAKYMGPNNGKIPEKFPYWLHEASIQNDRYLEDLQNIYYWKPQKDLEAALKFSRMTTNVLSMADGWLRRKDDEKVQDTAEMKRRHWAQEAVVENFSWLYKQKMPETEIWWLYDFVFQELSLKHYFAAFSRPGLTNFYRDMRIEIKKSVNGVAE